MLFEFKILQIFTQTAMEWRHFKALNRKNFISWTRTRVGSVGELVCPLLLMLLLVYLRLVMPRSRLENVDLNKLRHGLYPMTTWDRLNNAYMMDNDNLLASNGRLQQFMLKANITTSPGEYIPIQDIRGPLNFVPPHCLAVESFDVWPSPTIAYVKSDSKIQKQLVQQLETFYANQIQMRQLIKESDFLQSFVKQKKNEKKDEQIDRNNASPLSRITGIDRKVVQEGLPDIDFKLVEFESIKALDSAISEPMAGRDSPGICFGFTVHERASNDIELELFFNDLFVKEFKSLPSQTDAAVSEFQLQPKVREYAFYSYHGFAYLQNWAANTILRSVTRNQKASIAVATIPMKVGEIYKDPFAFFLGTVAPPLFILMYVPVVYRTSYQVGWEKERQLRQTMRMMGMRDTSYWLSWFAYYTSINLTISLAAMILAGFGIFSLTSITLIWAVFFLYGQALFGLILFLQTFFSEARTSALFTVALYLGVSALPIGGKNSYEVVNGLIAIFPSACFTGTVKIILGFEAAGLPVTWSSLNRKNGQFSVGFGLAMLVAAFVFWTLLGLFIEQKSRGKRPCKTGRRTGQNLRERESTSDASKLVSSNREFETAHMRCDAYEGVASEVAQLENSGQCIKLSNLRKCYPDGTHAVKGINLKMYKGQIFVLLGHNGAGKTSTISMLTGLHRPTEGTAQAFGVNMFAEFEKVQRFLGVCPQQDVLFDILTPLEHMELFYELKSEEVDLKKKGAEIQKLLSDLGVTDKMNDLTGQLSGGYQRKLSVALALCGGSKFIVLDEPTAGMDLTARRQTWKQLKEYKKDRIILISTHYMDEADILGDRIGIMSKGKLECLGSSMFLKRRYGVGYRVTMVKSNAATNKEVMPYFQARLGQEVKVVSEIQSELTMQISKQYSNRFEGFFNQFDKDLKKLKVEGYGISITTLEDVFMKVGCQQQAAEASDESESERDMLLDFEAEQPAQSTNETDKKSKKFKSRNNSIVRVTTVKRNQKMQDKSYESLNSTIHDQSNRELIKHEGGEGENKSKSRSSAKKSSIRQSSRNSSIMNSKQSSSSMQQQEGHQRLPNQQDLRRKLTQGRKVSFQTQHGVRRSTQVFDLSSGQFQNESLESQNEDHPHDEQFNISLASTDDSFSNSFKAVITKRFLIYKNSRKILFLEILLPIIFMVFGVLVSSFDHFVRSESRILGPERIGYPDQLVYLNRGVSRRSNGRKPIKDIQKYMKKSSKYLDIRMPKKKLSFNFFNKYVYKKGRVDAPKMPYCYSGYSFFEARNDQYKFYNLMNLTNQDAGGIYPQLMYEAILKKASGDKNFKFKVRSTPYPQTTMVRDRKNGADAGTVTFVTACAYSMMLAAVIGQMADERLTRLKHMQVISGVKLSAYWAGNFLVDLIKMEMASLATIILFFLMQPSYREVMFSYILFPFAAIPMTYVFSFAFESVASAQTFTIFSQFFLIMCVPGINFFLRCFKEFVHFTEPFNLIMKLFPGYCLSAGLYFNGLHRQLAQVRSKIEGWEISLSPWNLNNIAGDWIGLLLNFLFWTIMLAYVEKKGSTKKKKCKCQWICCIKICKKEKKEKKGVTPLVHTDRDVVQETMRVQNGQNEMDVKANSLRKVYHNRGAKLTAVDNLSFGVNKGECFSLLGVNGAGKSTIFKMLTGEEAPSGGKISYQGMGLQKNFEHVRHLIGYCPQQHLIIPALTVEQNIEYFATIKGIPEQWRQFLVGKAIRQLGLIAEKDKAAATLSGGNKRKLSVAIAVVGNPPIILLDEPSAGMDPATRRFMWDVVSQIASQKTSAVVLTSHLMEECEALSTKMGIMLKGGTFRCFGSSQHIKNKFGDGFEVQLKTSTPSLKQLKALAEKEFGTSDWIEVNAKLESLRKENKMTANQVKRELIEHYRHEGSSEDMIILENEDIASGYICPVNVFTEKLFIASAQFDSLKAICQQFKSVEVLEQYGAQMTLKISNCSSVGQMFGTITKLKNIDQYSISQTTLEQIFQSFFTHSSDNEHKTKYTLDDF